MFENIYIRKYTFKDTEESKMMGSTVKFGWNDKICTREIATYQCLMAEFAVHKCCWLAKRFIGQFVYLASIPQGAIRVNKTVNIFHHTS